MTWKDILESLTIDDVERFLYSLGVNYIRHEGADTLICPTICHNPIDEQGSMKLYWYQKNKTFHCYTECNENMYIFELYMKYCAINYGPITFMEAELYIKQFLSIFGIGYGVGFGLYGIYLLFEYIDEVVVCKGDFSSTINPWLTIIFCVLLFAICSANLWIKIRKEMKNSIVENIREL